MITLSEDVLNALQVATINNYPNEMCGFISTAGKFFELVNISQTPLTECDFDFDAITYAKDDIAYIVHSHTQVTTEHIQTPSTKDILAQIRLDIPFLITAYDGATYYQPLQLPHETNKDYCNREYIYAIQDCCHLLQDFYYYEFGITIVSDDSLRATRREEFSIAFQEEFLKNNFYKVSGWNLTNLQYGDILIASTVGNRKNHIMVHTGNNTLLHQLKQSSYVKLTQWYSRIDTVWRYSKELVCMTKT